MHPRFWASLVVLGTILATSPARADHALPIDENSLEDRLVDGDIDAEDQATMRLAAFSGSADVHGESWLSLVGFTNQGTFVSNIGAMVVVGLALDRIAAGSLHRLADPARPLSGPPVAPAIPPAQTQRNPLVAPALARECVAAALRASGLGIDDSRVDALISRSRVSAWLPETRMRAMRLMTDAARATTVATSDGTTYYDAVGAHLVLEVRLTWRFDRLVFAGDEPTLERTRLERQDARTRMAGRTLEVLFAWQRAVFEAQAALAGSQEELQARLRASEALATLDVLTDGWFSRRGD